MIGKIRRIYREKQRRERARKKALDRLKKKVRRLPARKRDFLVYLLRHPWVFFRGGVKAVYDHVEPVILDPAYQASLEESLSEYLWDYTHKKSVIHSVRWMGVTTLKMVSDLWIYQELIFRNRPQRVVEIGSLHGGSTLYLAQLLDLLGEGQVVSVDIDRTHFRASHPRIRAITGDCSSPKIFEEVQKMTRGHQTMVIHDGDHSEDAVLRDMRLYAPLVSVGQYFIIEDTLADLYNPSRIARPYPPGPLKAINRFLRENPGRFQMDMNCERFRTTFNPGGYLVRIA